MTFVIPSPQQLSIKNSSSLNIMISAPAGCGKTEALTIRIQGLLESGRVQHPRRILVITFSNRARDNISERLAARFPRSTISNYITVSNFHGLSARIFKAHANVIDMNPELTQPSSDWVVEELDRRGASWNMKNAVISALQSVKSQALTDEEVLESLRNQGSALAVDIETTRQELGLVTYDDLPRLCDLILSNERVARVYSNHFGAVVVDEFQDLTPQQLRIVRSIGRGKTTFAGDLAQGIYSFAGARPNIIAEEIEKESLEHFELNESYRSSPAVVRAVNSLNQKTGGKELECANLGDWPQGGVFSAVLYPDSSYEAECIVGMAKSILSHLPEHRIGIIARVKSRRTEIEESLVRQGVEAFRWEDGVHDSKTARRIRRVLKLFDLNEFSTSSDPFRYIQDLAAFEAVSNPDERVPLRDALLWCFDLLKQGEDVDAIDRRIRVGDSNTLINNPGIHLLTAHVGKGQQFDWVFVIGMEEGTLPFFKAESDEEIDEEARVLSVMISRARHGVLLSSAASVNGRNKQSSRFFQLLSSARPLDYEQTIAWFRSADFEALSER